MAGAKGLLEIKHFVFFDFSPPHLPDARIRLAFRLRARQVHFSSHHTHVIPNKNSPGSGNGFPITNLPMLYDMSEQK